MIFTSFIKRVNIKHPLRSRIGLAYNLGVLDTVGLPMNRINENPVIGGTRSPLRQDVSRNRLALCVELVKNGLNNDRAMTWCRAVKTCQQIRFVEILFSLRWCVELVLQSRTLSLGPKPSGEYSEEEPALQCRRQYCAPDSSSLKPGSGAAEGVLH